MNKTKIIFQKPWEYTLYTNQEKVILSVMFLGSRMDYSKEYLLEELQREASQEEVEELVNKIQTNQSQFESFEV